MSLPSPEQFLQKLEANPSAARAFDAATRREHPECKSRREAVIACLKDVLSLKGETAKLKSAVAAKKAKIASLAGITATNERLKKELASAKSKRGAIIAQASKPVPKAPATAVVKSIAALRKGETLSGRRYCKPTPTTTSPNRPRI